MSKSTTGLIIYGGALAVGALLLIANFVLHAFDGIPNGFRIAVVIYAVLCLGMRLWLGRQGYLVSRSKKPDSDAKADD